MRLWLDVHLSPRLIPWMTENFGVEAASLIDLGMYTLRDEPLFQRARREVDAIMTKDSDFLRLVTTHGRPPSIIYLTCGNTTNAELRRILSATLALTLSLIAQGESIVEIGPLP